MAAFELAAAEGATAIELDAQLTADEELVVFHDVTLSRLTSGDGRVSQRTFNELRSWMLGSQFAPEFRGQRIPRLDDVLGALAQTCSSTCTSRAIRARGPVWSSACAS